ncbi:hypothetical protein ACFLU5_02285 [Bacteroidota bacterium]
MRHSYLLILLLLGVSYSISNSAFCVINQQDSNIVRIYPDELSMVINLLGDRVTKTRYMEKNCKSCEYPGWEGFDTKRCTYSVIDDDGTNKTADVVLLNPNNEKLAKWLITTCKTVIGELNKEDIEKLIVHIIGQSGGQFPVAGIVYEDILPADGTFEIFCFRNGVTVEIEGIVHRGTEQPTKEQIEISLYGNVIKVFRYARIQSTTPQQYINNGGKVDVGNNDERKSAWMDVIKQLYQEAWNGDFNELMIAWAKENL